MIYNDRIYGKQEIKNKLILELIKTKEMQRLKGVNQYGTWVYINPKYNTTRFEHCIGVYLLLKKLNASREEQIAGLLHDVPHTAFSHVTDYVFNDHISQEYHQKFHEKIIKESKIPKILEKNNIDVDHILDEKNFKILEKDIPELCADRIDYLLRDSFVYGMIGLNKARALLNSFIVVDNELIMNDPNVAKEAAIIYMKMSSTMWTSPLQSGSYQILADAIKIAMEKGFVKKDDFFTTDKFLFSKLNDSGDSEILSKLKLINKGSITEGTKEDHNLFLKGKLRYIDPKYLENGKIRKLSENDYEFKQKLEKFKKTINNGFYIKINRGKRNYSVISETPS